MAEFAVQMEKELGRENTDSAFTKQDSSKTVKMVVL